ILTTKEPIATAKTSALIAVGDPTVADFVVINPRQIRVVGQRIGVTDLSVTTSDNRTYNFDVRVVADLDVLRGQLHQIFPDASLKLAQLRDHIVVEGQARDTAQVARILETIRAYLASVQAGQLRRLAGLGGRAPAVGVVPAGKPPAGEAVPPEGAPAAGPGGFPVVPPGAAPVGPGFLQ